MKQPSQNNTIGLKNVKSISTFRLLPSETSPIYHNAVTVPQFLQANLRSEHRIIKQFEGEDAILKAFYFGIMKLAFEIECDDQNYVQIVKKVLLSEQQFGKGQLEDQNLSDSQYRKFLLEFMDILQSQQIPSFEQTIQWYPIIDEILLKMFKRLVPITLKLKDNSELQIAKRILQFLCQKFRIQMQIISGCFKFIQSDIFLYLSNLNHIYLIFVDQLAFIKEVTEDHSEYSSKVSELSEKSKSHSSCVVNYEIKRGNKAEDNNKPQNYSSKSTERDYHRPFNTVINMLQSKRSSGQKSQLTASIHNRNSIQNKFQNITKNTSDKVKEKEYNLLQEYYASETGEKKFDQQISSLSTIKGNKSISSSYQSFLVDQKYNVQKKLVHTQTASQISQTQPGLYKKEKGSVKDHQQTCIQLKTPINIEPKSVLGSPSQTIESQARGKIEIKPIPQAKAKVAQEYQRQFSVSSNSKNSNLSLFSKVQAKMIDTEGKVQKHDIGDKSYEKFTDSGLLQMLDEEYKEKIRQIKKKYREQRANIKKFI